MGIMKKKRIWESLRFKCGTLIMLKPNKVLVDAMDQINSMQLNIDKNKTKAQEKTFKQHLKYLKENDKKVHKTKKNMVNFLSNLNIAMCYVFIKDQLLMPPLVNLSNSSFDDQLVVNNKNKPKA